jgi:lambda family phage portal protein
VADMVAALKHMRMAKKFSETVLQNAVVQASFAAAIESELPPEQVAAMMGAGSGTENYATAISTFMQMLGDYVGEAQQIAIDGVKIPHLFPGTKLNVEPLGSPGGMGDRFEASLHRQMAAAFGVSYEEFSRDFSGISYSGARASMGLTLRAMKAKKKAIADRFANFVYGNVLEEEIANGNLPLPRGVGRAFYYEPLMREAISNAQWVGAGAGQIDELKETQAAILRIKSGLSTYEKECAKLGSDFREIFEQRAREEGIIGKLNLAFSLEAQREGSRQRQNTLSDDPKSEGQKKDDKDESEAA